MPRDDTQAAATVADQAQEERTEDEQAEQNDEGSVEGGSENESSSSLSLPNGMKILAGALLFVSTVNTYNAYHSERGAHATSFSAPHPRRRLTESSGVPSYMEALMQDLEDREELMQQTPLKYWFEYTGPLQKYFYRYSKTRQKADSFEGRDDSGVVSSRFVEVGGGEEYDEFFSATSVPTDEVAAHTRLIDNCLAMGSPTRPSAEKGTFWYEWFGSESGKMDRCRVLVTMNMVGAGRGPTMLWETNPPALHANGPKPWISEQETAATHLERNLQEIDALCATGQIAARVQILVCEPIPGKWTDWMDSMLPNCGGKPGPLGAPKKARVEGGAANPYDEGMEVEERPSPIQVVVVASAATADTCHDLKSGFMEKRLQDLVLAPPYLESTSKADLKSFDPSVKTTHPDLVSSDDHDLYIAMKWSSMVHLRAVSAFLQASADLAAAAASPRNQDIAKLEKNADGVTVALTNSPSSPFLVPSFVRVSYVSEENSKVAKWRMHGDFFHPAAWEVCADSYDMTWLPDSLSGSGGIHGVCYEEGGIRAESRRLDGNDGGECGQWWVYMAEEQMPTSPEVYANEVTSPLILGGSNFFWMITERQRQEIVKIKVCEHEAGSEAEVEKCGQAPQAVMPLGDLESFLINFTPNTALGKKHVSGRRPGYTKEKEREGDRDKVRERKQLKGQEDIEKALFDYTVYPAALFHKDATIKAARARDAILTRKEDRAENAIGPQTVKSAYYDVTMTKPREATLAWCQAVARKGLCTLYAEYFRESPDVRCWEACGMRKNWSRIEKDSEL